MVTDSENKPTPPAQQMALDIRWTDIASLDSFVVGANQQALDAVRRAAMGFGERLLFLYGNGPVGKSHLLQAACRDAGERGFKAAYLPLREFQGMPPASVLAGMESMELLALDDLQVLAGEPDWEENFFYLFNRTRASGGHMLLSADCRPADLSLILPDLASRLQWGLTLRLEPLDDEGKLQGLQARAAARGLELPEDTGRFLLSRFPRDLGGLFELLDRLDGASLAAQRRLTIPFVRQVLGAGEG
ncbi:regulatory inactivation of DnaA Hda protein [Alkalispirillum mobile]|uniref:Regulatory inactivation of DnaA Hda protein n=1 Tax=Alkalispirillum mobile TaxID=85925 RepID=A0A498C5X7_9GAMM|nr:DnaA regulatory inactivator Hda [Alkalispirillum mobile]RLK51235.1 regulatory inactivation of DnaA Hda protein [Alkalispirillum mobile]